MILVISTSGCALTEYSEQISALKAVGESQKDIGQYIDEKERLFYILLDDVKKDRLKAGMSKKGVVNLYGRAVFSREVDNRPPAKEVFLYRHPTDYFSSDRVYLYFDASNKLAHWEYTPSQ